MVRDEHGYKLLTTTSRGDIYPARGMIKTEDGKIILTRYPTDNIDTRTPHKSANCTPS